MTRSGNGKPWTVESICRDLEKRSEALKNLSTPHLVCVFAEGEAIQFWSNVTKDEAARVIVMLKDLHGGEVIEQAMDRILDEGDGQTSNGS